MSRKTIVVVLVMVLGFAVSVGAANPDSEETRREQQKALSADMSTAPVHVGAMSPEAKNLRANGELLFVAVDDTTVPTYAIDPDDGTTTAQFTGFDPWGAALIPAGVPGDGVVYFNSGTSLYRWPADGSPELCCTLTLAASAMSAVGMAYDSVAGELLFSRNVANEAIYSLPAVAGSCPGACEVTLQREYVDADFDFGGLAYDSVTGVLYGSSDDSSPGPQGVYSIALDGTATLVVAYPDGQTDIDGLAYGNGKLFLVIDQPGSIYVYDIAGATWDPPLTNPWTTSEIFAAGAYGTGLIPVELQSFNVE